MASLKAQTGIESTKLGKSPKEKGEFVIKRNFFRINVNNEIVNRTLYLLFINAVIPAGRIAAAEAAEDR